MPSIFWLVLLFIPGFCDKNELQIVESDSCPSLLDLVFVLDTSGSIDEVYDEQIRWTKALVEALPISPEAVRIATLQYAGSPIVEFSLNTNKDKASVAQRLESIQFQSGVTRTGLALKTAEDELFSPKKGARSNASKIIILFTDGLSIDDPNKPSNHLRDVKGVNIYVISVGTDGFVPEMQKIAGDVENVYGPSDLSRFKEQILIDVEASRRCVGTSSTAVTTKLTVPFRQHQTTKSSTTFSAILSTSSPTTPLTNSTASSTRNSTITKKRKKIRVVRRKIRRNGDLGIKEEIIRKNGKKVRRIVRRKIRTTTPLVVNTTTEMPSSTRKSNFRLIKKKSTTSVITTDTTSTTSSEPVTTTSSRPTTTTPEITTTTSTRATATLPRRTSTNHIFPTLATEKPTTTHRPVLESKKELPRAFAARNQIIPADGECPMDILFIVDSSGSVGSIYEKQKVFLSSILESINPEEHSHRVALIQFAGARLQKIQWTFDSFSQNGEIMRAFNALRHFTGTTYIGAALETAVSQLYTRRHGVPTIVIVISDGFSYDDVRTSAAKIRVMENVELYVATLAPLSNIPTLLEIAGDESRLFTEGEVEVLRSRLLNRFQCEN